VTRIQAKLITFAQDKLRAGFAQDKLRINSVEGLIDISGIKPEFTTIHLDQKRRIENDERKTQETPLVLR
jgi:hypothetical protein